MTILESMDGRLKQLCDEHGAFLRRDALRLGYDDRMIEALIRVGEWHRVRRGAYTLAPLWANADARQRHAILARAAHRAARSKAVLSHTSAVLEHTDQYWGLDLDEVHLTRLDGRAGRREAGIRQHRGKVIAGDVIGVNGVSAMSVVRSALELTTITDVERSLVVINGLLHAKACTREELLSRYEGMASWPHTLTTELTLRIADPRISSVGESRTEYLLWSQGLPYAEPQYPVHDRNGEIVAYLDFAWPALKCWLEFDGKAKYTEYARPGEDPGDVVVREKKREDLVRRLTGWRCIRITWFDLSTPERTAAMIRRELTVAA